MKHLSGISILTPVCAVVIALSCSPATRIAVNNVNETGSLQTGSFLYALPLTVIDVQVKAEEVTIIPGPYFMYADKYLGIKDVPEKPENTWHIVEMQLVRHIEADPDYIYTVRGIDNPDAVTGISRLLSDGLLLEAKNFSFDQAVQINAMSDRDQVVFTDLSIKRNFEVEKDVDISLVMPGTDDEAVPVRQHALKEKTIEQKAEEAANFLIKLKKRRFKLVAGQYEYMPEGEAMAAALKELARLEEEYLSLFIGKRKVTPYQRIYSYAPATGKENDRVVLFRFAENEGFVDARESGGIPVVVELNDKNKTRALEQFRVPLRIPVNELLYRVADQVAVKLMVGEQIQAEATYPVFQCGAIVPMNLGK
jgi:hypothetical protein